MAEVNLRFSLNQNEEKERFKGVKHVVAVWSAKGGVGKTTVAIGLAYALSSKATVGLLDLDINCPAVSDYLNVKPMVVGDSKRGIIYPVIVEGIKVFSIGFLSNENEPILWRGPMLSNALNEISQKVLWNVDILVVDMPPGTSDVAIDVLTKIKPDGFVVVTGPSRVEWTTTKRSIKAIERFNIPIIATVKNFSNGPRDHGFVKADVDLNECEDIASAADKGISPFNVDCSDYAFNKLSEKVLKFFNQSP